MYSNTHKAEHGWASVVPTLREAAGIIGAAARETPRLFFEPLTARFWRRNRNRRVTVATLSPDVQRAVAELPSDTRAYVAKLLELSGAMLSAAYVEQGKIILCYESISNPVVAEMFATLSERHQQLSDAEADDKLDDAAQVYRSSRISYGDSRRSPLGDAGRLSTALASALFKRPPTCPT